MVIKPVILPVLAAFNMLVAHAPKAVPAKPSVTFSIAEKLHQLTHPGEQRQPASR